MVTNLATGRAKNIRLYHFNKNNSLSWKRSPRSVLKVSRVAFCLSNKNWGLGAKSPLGESIFLAHIYAQVDLMSLTAKPLYYL